MYGVFEEYYVNEYCKSDSAIAEQVLQEMNFSKKDLQNPETVKKVLNAKYPSVREAMLTLLTVFVVIVSIIGTICTFGIGLAIIGPLFIKFVEWSNDLAPKYKKKTVEKFLRQCNKLKEKCEKELKKNPNNNDAKKVLNNVNNVLKKYEQEMKKIEDKKEQERIELEMSYYEKLVHIIEDPSKIGETWENYNLLEDLFSIISVKDFIKRLDACKDKLYYISAKEFASETIGKEEYEELLKNNNLFNSVKDHKFFDLHRNDDITIVYDINNKTIYALYTDNTFEVYNDFNKNVSTDAFKEADRLCGYYRLSNPPEGIIPKEFPIK